MRVGGWEADNCGRKRRVGGRGGWEEEEGGKKRRVGWRLLFGASDLVSDWLIQACCKKMQNNQEELQTSVVSTCFM